MLKTVVVWLLAAWFTADSIAITLRNRWNAGTLMMWCASTGLLLYGVFHTPVDAFLATGVGFVLKILFFVALALFVGLLFFIGLQGRKREAKGDEKAILVLGAGLRKKRVSDLLRRRLVAAKECYIENKDARLVVSGGQGPGEEITEAEAMEQWLVKAGVPAGDILKEEESTSTETNLLYSKTLLQQSGIGPEQPVAIVTNTFHCYRAKCYAKKLGYRDVRCVPASMNASTFLENYMREALALIYMWLFRRGTRQEKQS
ncbi:YdcF family protein [Ruminococcaceae bacterium OttesenSCG-928-I18]|nr:YdcF family protein [Ruminococcaceae bacterium OttesenSCG-928-I18]